MSKGWCHALWCLGVAWVLAISFCGSGSNFVAENIPHHEHKAIVFHMLRLADATHAMKPQNWFTNMNFLVYIFPEHRSLMRFAFQVWPLSRAMSDTLYMEAVLSHMITRGIRVLPCLVLGYYPIPELCYYTFSPCLFGLLFRVSSFIPLTQNMPVVTLNCL